MKYYDLVGYRWFINVRNFILMYKYISVGGFKMKNKMSSIMAIITCAFLLVFGTLSVDSVSAALADGTYSIENYQVLKADSNAASIANGYFLKPAKLIVEDGTNYVQLTIKESNMVQSLTGPYGKAVVVSEDKAKQHITVKFKVEDISKAVTVGMHIIVDAEEIQYDTTHKARLVFDEPTSTGTTNTNTNTAPSNEPTNQDKETSGTVENPKTGDEMPIVLFSLLLIGSGMMVARKFVTK